MDKDQKIQSLRGFESLLQKQTGKAVRPYHADGYMNLLNKYGTAKDTSEHYQYREEPPVPDDLLTQFYEGNGLFARIIDAPAEEAVKHGFTLNLKDSEVQDFYEEALDELDWDETCMTAIKWTRLFGGCIVVMLINDGRGINEPLDWKHIQSIDDLRIYDRSLLNEDTSNLFNWSSEDPFRTRSSRLGMPEYYDVFSKYGTFRVHESRCLVFQNGVLPENTSNSIYQMWGVPEYIRINKAIRDAEVAHGSAVKLLDRSIQAIYKMNGLSAELATEEGEDRVLRRLQTIDTARGMLNSITIDADNEDYDFKTFQFSGVSDVIDTTCNYLSALTNIPQTILFGRSPAGMNATGASDLENWYNFIERIQTRMIRKNLRYLLSVIFQAGVACGEIDEVPELKIEFNPLWSLSDLEKADLDQKKASVQQTRAQTAAIYMEAQVIDPSEVRAKLADSSEFDIETMLDEYDDEDLFANMPEGQGEEPMNPAIEGQEEELEENGERPDYAEGVDVEEHNVDPGTEGSAPTAAPAATKLPQDMSPEEKEKAEEAQEERKDHAYKEDGGPGSGNYGHKGVEGQLGGSAKGGGKEALSKSLGECKAGRVAYDQDGYLLVKRDDGDWISPATGEILTDDDLADQGITPLKYEGSLDFGVGSIDQEYMDGRMSEFVRNQYEKYGESNITSQEVHDMIEAIANYGSGDGDIDNALWAEDPETYAWAEEVNKFTDEEKEKAKQAADNIEKYIDLSDKYEGYIYRGMAMNSVYDGDERCKNFVSALKEGETMDMGHFASWAMNEGVTRDYSDTTMIDISGTNYSVTFQARQISAAPAPLLLPHGEVLSPKSARYKITGVHEEYDEGEKLYTYRVNMEEI